MTLTGICVIVAQTITVEFVYHDKVPDLGAVDIDFKGVSLVKGIPFSADSDGGTRGLVFV